MRVAQVIINRPAKQLHKPLSYLMPEKFGNVLPGTRVLIPLGHSREEGILIGYKELVDLYDNCKGKATFTYILTGEGDTLTFSLDQKGALIMDVTICTTCNYKCNMTIESLDQTYLPRFIEFFKEFLEREPK